MSCEEDDDVWDDPEPVITKAIRQININTLTQDKLKEIENGLILCVEQKLEKLNVILKNMEVYAVGDSIIVNDRYSVCTKIADIIAAFGMEIKQIYDAKIRGKSYIFTDDLVGLLKRMGSSYEFGDSIANCQPDSLIVRLATDNAFRFDGIDLNYDKELATFLNTILHEGELIINGVETFIDGVSQGVESDASIIEHRLGLFLKQIEDQVKVNNKNMQNGTTEIICHRAKQMGYAVKKEVNDKQVQLVLVRTR